ncbi:efflux RND transporter periplasmic adaptor subunit [Thalassomonas viridans]|uniref:Efflux RND transporter periplasmic adaptor subunit n=1 Tax=Thalassomonas viridans TaxID=137584 RepID=A0AAE9Z6M3_9GAMM|nr:efflux RND transporter periplasmic adaptor subunit [Thalassomonas viridans]WDE06062.1 efflux RND transporter periplasmic adaptor subunit [Thalassomonas viridans]
MDFTSTQDGDSSQLPNSGGRRMVPLRYVLTPIAIILAAIFILIVATVLAPKPVKKPQVFKAPLVEVMPLEYQDTTFRIASQGSVAPRTETRLVSEVSGPITQVSDNFLVGGFFRKGEMLLSIDDISYKVALQQARSRLETAEASLIEEQARVEQAEDEWLLTGKSLKDAPVMALRTPNLKKAKAELAAARANVAEAEVKLARTKIVAPYDAMLKAKNVDIGQYVTTGSELATTFAVDYAEVRLPVKQKDVEFLNLPRINQGKGQGMAVELYYQLAGKTYRWPAVITRYEGVVDSASRVHYVVAQLDDPYNVLNKSSRDEIRVGTFVKASIQGKQISGVAAIPRSALHGADRIYLAGDDNALMMQKINVLRSDLDYVYTRDKLDTGLRLVLTNLDTAVEGMALRIHGEEGERLARDEAGGKAPQNSQASF